MKQLSDYNAGVRAAIYILCKEACIDHKEGELDKRINPSEKKAIEFYGNCKGLDQIITEYIISNFSNKNLREVFLDSTFINNISNSLPFVLEKQLEFKKIKKLARILWEENCRLDPEELKILERILKIEGYMTPKNLEKFYELINPYNQDRKICAFVQGKDKAKDWYLKQLNKAGFHTCFAYLNKDGSFRIKDHSKKGDSNLFLVAPYHFSEEERTKIIEFFGSLDEKGIKIPRLAAYTKKGDLPQKFKVHVCLPETTTIPAMVEQISGLYKDFYLGIYNGDKNGR